MTDRKKLTIIPKYQRLTGLQLLESPNEPCPQRLIPLYLTPFLDLAKFRLRASRFLHVLLIAQSVSILAVLLFAIDWSSPSHSQNRANGDRRTSSDELRLVGVLKSGYGQKNSQRPWTKTHPVCDSLVGERPKSRSLGWCKDNPQFRWNHPDRP